MLKKLATLGSLGLAVVLPTAAFADHDRDDGRGQNRDGDRRGGSSYDDGYASRLWIGGHFEIRETQRVVPAVVRQEWVPDRVETVCIPAVTERVCIPAVTERVYVPAVVERRRVPETRERCFVPGRYEISFDARGCRISVWIGSHYEERVTRAARYDECVVRPAHYEERVVCQERFETRIVVPERRETRVVERAHCVTVVVRPERTECVREKVWIPGQWETRPARERR